MDFIFIDEPVFIVFSFWLVVATAKTYAKTIISEYFLHVKDKTILRKNLGGYAGGQV